MKQFPLVSIITPSFNQGQFIEQTILSVLNQNYPNIEYIVMDGGSEDETLNVLRQYEGHLRWVSEPDRGQSHAINKGWQSSRGELVTWINSDDFYEPHAIATLVNGFQTQTDAAVVYGELDYVASDSSILRRAKVEPKVLPGILVSNVIGQPNALIARWAIDKVGMIDEDLNYVMDFDLWLRLAMQYRFVFLPAKIANARVHGDSKTFGDSYKHLSECIHFLKKYYDSDIVPQWAHPYRNRVLGYWQVARGFYWLDQGNYRMAAYDFWAAIRYDRRYIKNKGVQNAFIWAVLGDHIAQKLRSRFKDHRKNVDPDLVHVSIDPITEIINEIEVSKFSKL